MSAGWYPHQVGLEVSCSLGVNKDMLLPCIGLDFAENISQILWQLWMLQHFTQQRSFW